MFFRIIFYVFTKVYFSFILGSILASFLWFVQNFSQIVLKLADLRKCSQRQHGSMIFEVWAPHILMIFLWFSGGQKVTKMSSKIDAKIGIEKSWLRGRRVRKIPATWWSGGVPPLGPCKPSLGRASTLRQCTCTSLGIAFASLFIFHRFLSILGSIENGINN